MDALWERNDRVNRLLCTLAIAGVVCTVLYLQVRSMLAASPAQAGTPLVGIELTADRDENSLQIRWNQEAPLVLSAKSGALVIRENGKQTKVELSGTALRLGQAPYQWPSGEVAVQLTLRMPDGGTVTESLVSIAEPAPTPRQGLRPVEAHLVER